MKNKFNELATATAFQAGNTYLNGHTDLIYTKTGEVAVAQYGPFASKTGTRKVIISALPISLAAIIAGYGQYLGLTGPAGFGTWGAPTLAVTYAIFLVATIIFLTIPWVKSREIFPVNQEWAVPLKEKKDIGIFGVDVETSYKLACWCELTRKYRDNLTLELHKELEELEEQLKALAAEAE